jgi:hypothetical protein
VGVYFKKNGQWVGPVFLYRSYYIVVFYQLLDQFYIFTSVASLLSSAASVRLCQAARRLLSLSLSLSPPLSHLLSVGGQNMSLFSGHSRACESRVVCFYRCRHTKQTPELHQQALALFDAARSVGSTENHQIHQQADTRPDEGAWGCCPVGGWPEEICGWRPALNITTNCCALLTIGATQAQPMYVHSTDPRSA